MLLEFSCTNYKSIKETVKFSMIASKDNSHEKELKNYNDFRLLSTASIYGANGSGKSNFIKAIESLKSLIINSINFQPGDKLPNVSHKLSEKDVPTSYAIQFIRKNIRYAYGASLLEEKVVEEYLYYFPNNKQAKIFDRNGSEVSFGEKFKKSLETSLKDILKPNRLFLSCAANFSNVIEIENAFLFFKQDLVLYQSSLNNWLDYSVKTLQNDAEIKRIFLDIMKNIQPGLYDINAKVDKKKIDLNEFPMEMPEELKKILTSKEAEVIDVKLNYENFIIDLNEESNGIKKLFEILCPIIDILLKDKVLIWDEIETSLHPTIVLELIKLFKHSKQSQFAQLIFSTHDTSLLDLDLFRRDQIWFTELKPETHSTDLYSLAELKNVRKDENVYKGYISGKYGAIPLLNSKLIDILNKEEFKNE